MLVSDLLNKMSYLSMYMYFTKTISRNFVVVEGYEDEALGREFNFFFHSSFSKVKLHAVFDPKNNNITTYL